MATTAIDLIREFEGCRLVAYQDIGGVWTIGWGHTGKDVHEGLTITIQTAEELLGADIAEAQHLLKLYSPSLAGGALDAITDFVFNLGSGTYRTSTLRSLVNAERWAEVKVELLKWDHVHGKVVPGLLRRRQAEAALIAV